MGTGPPLVRRARAAAPAVTRVKLSSLTSRPALDWALTVDAFRPCRTVPGWRDGCRRRAGGGTRWTRGPGWPRDPGLAEAVGVGGRGPGGRWGVGVGLGTGTGRSPGKGRNGMAEAEWTEQKKKAEWK